MDTFSEIKAFYRNLSDSHLISESDVEEIAFDGKRYQAAIEDVRGRLNVKLINGFCSSLLVEQIARHYCNIGERFGNKIEFYHGSTILDTIEQMEVGRWKGTPFSKSRFLDGLHKQHHSALSQISSIARNISEGLSEKAVESAKQRGGSSQSGLLNTIHSNIIAKRNRTGKLKGEWIVLAKVGRLNYYLCLATHEEGDGEAEIIYNKLMPAVEEFHVLHSFKGRK
jgi:hypothetical protein